MGIAQYNNPWYNRRTVHNVSGLKDQGAAHGPRRTRNRRFFFLSPGAAGTRFWIDPREALFGLFMIQIMPGGHYPIADEFEVLTYQALVDE